MTHEAEVYAKEIKRLKKRVNKLIDIIDSARMEAYDPYDWVTYHSGDANTDLDKETIVEYTET